MNRTRSIPNFLCFLALTMAWLPAAIGADEDTEPTPAERAKSQNNLRQIGLAMLNYEATYKYLPGNIVDKDGKPLLSWRVAILPFIEQDDLYKQFKLGEPWDSENNKKLVEKMPKIYAPNRGKAVPGTTFYLRLSGEGTALNPKKQVKITDIKDGASNTLWAVEAAAPVEWTKPEDLEFGVDKELPKFGGMFKGDFNALFHDGAVSYVKKGNDPKLLKALITIRGKESINRDDLK
jgi:hypothetical protein